MNKDLALNAFYDLEVCPYTFDIAKFIILAAAAVENLTDIVLIIVPPTKLRMDKLKTDYLKHTADSIPDDFFPKRIQNILFKIAHLFPEVNNVLVLSERSEVYNYLANDNEVFPQHYDPLKPIAHYGIEYLMAQIAKGLPPVSIRIPKTFQDTANKVFNTNELLSSNMLVLCVRNTFYEIWRNTKISNWIEFANIRIDEGYQIVWLLDYESITSPKITALPGTVLQEDDISMRAAIFNICTAALFVNSGLATLARYNHDVVSASFKLLDSRSPATTRKFWSSKGIQVGKSLPFMSPLHFNCWEEDTLENLQGVWRLHLLPLINMRRADRVALVAGWVKDIESLPKYNIQISEQISSEIPVFIWGVGTLATEACSYLARLGIKCSGVIDSYQYDSNFNIKHVIHPSALDSMENKHILICAESAEGIDRFDTVVALIKNMYPQNVNLVNFKYIK